MLELREGWVGTIGQFMKQLQDSTSYSKSDVLDLISYITSTPLRRIPFCLSDELLIDKDICEVLSLLKKNFPIAYITRRKEFYGNELYVDERVLIPRPETEILVDFVLENAYGKGSVLDIGTGSGCILISVLNEAQQLTGVGVDICLDALTVAMQNLQFYGLDEVANLVCADATDMEQVFNRKFDIVTCNPPYIGRDDDIGSSILFEPSKALFAKDDGLYFYKKLLSIGDKLCNKGGLMCFEIGANQRCALEAFGKETEKELDFIQDYAGHDRVMIWRN